MRAEFEGVAALQKEKEKNFTDFKEQVKAMDKAKSEKEFAKLKKAAEKALALASEQAELQSKFTPEWEAKIKNAKTWLEKDKKLIATRREKWNAACKAVEAHNKIVEDLNKNVPDKKNQMPLIPLSEE